MIRACAMCRRVMILRGCDEKRIAAPKCDLPFVSRFTMALMIVCSSSESALTPLRGSRRNSRLIKLKVREAHMAVVGATAAHAVREMAHRLEGAHSDYDPVMELVGEARLVLLGEASHGTHEFYRERAAITKRLLEEKGFTAVAVEADWPDAYRVNRYVRGVSQDADAAEALSDFRRFPTWMWRNADVLDFIGWLRERNDAAPSAGRKVGF